MHTLKPQRHWRQDPEPIGFYIPIKCMTDVTGQITFMHQGIPTFLSIYTTFHHFHKTIVKWSLSQIVRWSSLQQPKLTNDNWFYADFQYLFNVWACFTYTKIYYLCDRHKWISLISTCFDPPSTPSCRNKFSLSPHPPCIVYRDHKVGLFKNAITNTQWLKHYNNIHLKIALEWVFCGVGHRSCLWLGMSKTSPPWILL